MPKNRGKSAKNQNPEPAEGIVPEAPVEEAVWSIRPETSEPVTPPSPPMPAAGIVTEGDLAIAEGAHLVEALHVTGGLRVGPKARVDGPVTVLRDAEVGPGARFANALTVEGALRWAPDAEAEHVAVRGPLLTGADSPRVASLMARRGIHPDPGSTGGALR